jgi:dTDP-glucose pyrophosphorylase
MNETPLAATAPLVDAVRAIESSPRRIAVVTDEAGRLLGTLTDGDIRRCLLSAGTLDTAVERAMNSRPITAPAGSQDAYLLDLMRRGNVMAIPLVDASGRFLRLVHLRDLSPADEPAGYVEDVAFAVIMAGGDGLRLRPLTETVPKAMVEIGGVPLLERQLERLARAGIKRVYISVHYLSHVIEEHIGDGRSFGLEVGYLREPQKLGTAGALSLLPEQPAKTIIVMNGDILTAVDFGSFHAYHKLHAAHVTVAAVDYRIQIPYGVINTDGPYATGVLEKPSQRFLCNAGVYAIAPDVLSLLPASDHCNMTDLLETCLAAKYRVAVFPVHEYWSDIGTVDDLEKARAQFSKAI